MPPPPPSTHGVNQPCRDPRPLQAAPSTRTSLPADLLFKSYLSTQNHIINKCLSKLTHLVLYNCLVAFITHNALIV